MIREREIRCSTRPALAGAEMRTAAREVSGSLALTRWVDALTSPISALPR
jgi:hypothetical protein